MARATKLTLSIHKTRLVFTFRRFKTQKANRSKRLQQVVIPIYGLPYKELAIAKSRIGRRTKGANLANLLIQPYLLMVVLSLAGIGYFGIHLTEAPKIQLASNQTRETVKPKPAKHLNRSPPTRLQIDAINLDAPLAQVGLKADGSLQVPSDPSMAGWYRGSPTPGEIGPAIIDGHVDRIGGIAIFWRLRELQPGDVIRIDRQDDTTAQFKVDNLQQFAQDGFPSQRVYGNINYAGLRLITCGGVFNSATGHYSDNIVVFASLQG